MNEQQLPPLPENPKHVFLGHHIYTAEQMQAYARAALAANVPADLLAALRTAVDHIDMGALELSHCKDWAQIKEALAAPAPDAALPNGLTESETSASPSVAGLGAPAQAQQSEPTPAVMVEVIRALYGEGYLAGQRGAKPEAQHPDTQDAERYRWLRDEHIGDDPESINLRSGKTRGLDAAIDWQLIGASGEGKA